MNDKMKEDLLYYNPTLNTDAKYSSHICSFSHPFICKQYFDPSRGVLLSTQEPHKRKFEINVGFIGAVSNEIKKKIQTYASEWTKYAKKVRFVFVDDVTQADVRISLHDTNISWAIPAEYCIYHPTNQPTMNLAITDATPDQEVKSVVLHEFGHVLGLKDEHQHPKSKVKWNGDLEIPGWKDDLIETQLMQRYDIRQTQFESFDFESIMIAPVPVEWTTDGIGVDWSKGLTEGDIKFARNIKF
jgi:hypothetical protein